jgi:protein-L-isoaspartate O-methyltransferase
MARMLDLLQVTDDAQIAEIGTGTGYNAALLCHRLGAGQVTSIDIDPELVARAAARLAEIGYTPTLAAGDGLAGHPGNAPYDAILATCSLTHIPPAWINQLTPGGRLVVPLGPAGGGLAVLAKTGPDEVTGRFDPVPACFMPLRPAGADPRSLLHRFDPSRGPRLSHDSTTDVDPAAVLHPEFLLWLELHLSPVSLGQNTDEATGRPTETVVSSPEGYAAVAHTPTATGRWPVSQHGRRRPWDTVEAAWHIWTYLDRPARTRLGISALDDPNRQYVWLDDPASAFSWPLPL